jgi:hypothetical protein
LYIVHSFDQQRCCVTGLGNGLTRVHFSLVTAKKPQKQQMINSTSNNTTCLKEK